MTSMTMTRRCELAVVWSRSMASEAMLTAVSKPKVVSVPQTSLSMVLGTPTMLRPMSESIEAVRCVPLPPMHTSASRPRLR